MSGGFQSGRRSTRLQKLAETALRDGLMNYDRRYGWRGPIAKINIKNNWFARLNRVRRPVGIRGWRLAVVLYPHERSAELGFTDGPAVRCRSPK